MNNPPGGRFLAKKPGMKKPARGRPLKYGRPSRVVAITLPQDTIDELRRIHADIGRAIVTLVSTFGDTRDAAATRRVVELEKFGRRRSLIVVDREAVKGVPGCELIPLGEDRALLALEDGRGLPDLELAVLDRLADPSLARKQRDALEALRRTLRECRMSPGIEVEPRSILVVEKSSRSRLG